MSEMNAFDFFCLSTAIIFVLNRYGLQTETTKESKFLIKSQGNGSGLGTTVFQKMDPILSGITELQNG